MKPLTVTNKQIIASQISPHFAEPRALTIRTIREDLLELDIATKGDLFEIYLAPRTHQAFRALFDGCPTDPKVDGAAVIRDYDCEEGQVVYLSRNTGGWISRRFTDGAQ